MRILVTGGAGYVGSVSAQAFLALGHEVTILDTLVTGHRRAALDGAQLIVGSVGEREPLTRLMRDRSIEAVLHCAARSLVGESVAKPALYYRENVVGGVELLDAMREAGVERIVFSSTAAVYGAPETTPITEDSPTRPINPYGATKLAFEAAMRWYGEAYGIKAMALRYFNVAGATAALGEQHDPETHLIPNVLASAEGGRRVVIMGTDYPTRDGSCVRDYIHVSDLADAHLGALERTATAEPGLEICNLGSGSGFTVLEVLAAAEAIVGAPIPHDIGERRAGDPPVLVASNDRAREVLGWTPKRGSLEEMIGSAWAWRQAHPGGYGTN